MSVKKILYITVGSVSFGLGAIGTVLPFLPTVPFLLLSTCCFAKSSAKLNAWFKSTKIYKNNLEGYAKGEGMHLLTKVKIMTLITLLLFIGFLLMKKTLIGRIVLVAVWIGHFIYFTFFVDTTKE
ncbi:MAG: DUF454 domain-containing protein [Treponema sp.]|jgi:uncharacterized membrane protein YbaN (DUF454 family)|nr:DUF454 domain-containing protein [Treponema sp.]